MALNTCTDCGNPVSDAAAACPHCGRPGIQIEAAAVRRKVLAPLRAVQWITGTIFAIGLALALTADSTQMRFWIGTKLCVYSGLICLVAMLVAWRRRR